jgi:P4 family phage/plasmid primase-like protien
MLELTQKNLLVTPKTQKFLDKFPNTLFTYIPDYSDKLPVIHSEVLDLTRQEAGYGIFFTINGFTGGTRTNESLTNVNAFFADIDFPDKLNRTPEAIHEYKQEMLMELYEEGVTPTFIVETKNGLHVYWVLKSPIFLNTLNEQQQNELRIRFRDIEEGILRRFDGDPGAKDLARVLRVPETLHQKDKDHPFTCKLVHSAPTNTFTFVEIQEAFLKQPAPIGWAVAMGENAISKEVKEGIEKEYPKLERPSYKKLFSKEEGSIPEGMRNKALLIAAYAAKEAGWKIEKVFEHFKVFHGLSLREIRKTIRSAYDHQYDFGYNNEVMAEIATQEERSILSKTTSKILADDTKEERLKSNYSQKERYLMYEYVIAERLPNLLYKQRGDFYNYRDGVYLPIQLEEVRSLFLSEMLKDGLTNFRTVSRVNDKIACFKSLQGRTFTREQENPDINILNFKNGLLNIETYELREHTPSYLSTSQIPISYDRQARSPLWFKFIADITSGDVEQALLLQQIAGYCLTNDTRYAKAFILFGSGANGKSLFTRMVAKLIGREYVSSLNLTTITKQFGLTGLIGKKLNIIDEISGNYFESNIIKNIISGETMAAEVKFRPEPLEFDPIVKLIFSVNELPKINDTTPGIYRRFIIVPFSRNFLANPDLDLEYKLSTELPGILNWAVEGLKSLRAQGKFSEAQKNLEALNMFKIENSPFLEFLTNTYEPTDEREHTMYPVLLSDLYSQYRTYCVESGYKPKSIANFGREISHTVLPGWSIERARLRNINYVYGIRRLKLNSGMPSYELPTMIQTSTTDGF